MTQEPILLDDLLAAREGMIEALVRQMPEEHRRFLVSFERGNPDWSILGLPHVADLPAVQWRQINLDNIPHDKRNQLVADLEEVLSAGSDQAR